MLSSTKERLLLELLSSGQFSERQLAAKAGVSRRAVRSRKAGYRAHSKSDDNPISREMRCPICHAALTEIPCRVCAAEAYHE